jgi:hypothetical protein
MVFVRAYRTFAIAERRGKSRFMAKARRQEWLPANEIRSSSQRLECAGTIASHLERSREGEVRVLDVPVAWIKLGDTGSQNAVESRGGRHRRCAPLPGDA